MTGAHEARKPKILLADDDEPFQRAIAIVLRASGFNVTAVGDGNHAILAFEVAILGKEPFDLLLLDLRMPGATGWEVLRYVRTHNPPAFEPPRVLLTTGFTVELDLDRVKQDRADGILLKPFMMTALVNEVRRILSLHHAEPAEADSRGRDVVPPAHR
jgi:two-component system, NtrC family, response regulator AtoC